MPKKKKPSLLLILGQLFTDSIWDIGLAVVSGGYLFYRFYTADLAMLEQIPVWAWWAVLVFFTFRIIVKGVQIYRKDLESQNSSSEPPGKRKGKVNKAGNQSVAMQDVNNSPVTQNFYQEKSNIQRNTNPILRIRDYGNQTKELFGTNNYAVAYDTLFIDIFNKQKSGSAERVWSNIEWINVDGAAEVSHRGRWHIATETMRNEKIKENLQYRNIDSNQSPQRLYFAWTTKDNTDNHFYGLERDMDGVDSWGYEKYKLDAEQYIVKITLYGNNGVKQEFRYRIKNNNGKISITDTLTNESKKRN